MLWLTNLLYRLLPVAKGETLRGMDPDVGIFAPWGGSSGGGEEGLFKFCGTLENLGTFVKPSQFYLQRKPEEDSPRKDDAKKAKQELEVNGGSGDAVSSGNEVSENMEEEVGN